MRIYSLKRNAIPKLAVLATGLTAAILVATINPVPAQATPSEATACTDCHTAGGSVTATPSSTTLAPGASYTVGLAFTGGSSPSGFWISGNGASVTGSSSTSATMTAPATAGPYTYTVWVRSGVVASTTYSITVGSVVTTPPVTTTTEPPVTTTTEPPVTTTTEPPVTTTTEPPVTTTTQPPVITTTQPPVITTTEPPVITTTEPPVITTTEPPVTTTTEPPVTTTTEPPVTTNAQMTSMSPRHGAIGTMVTIQGSGFGDLGSVQFGTVVTTAKSWTGTKIVFEVPAGTFAKVAHVSVTPGANAASNAVSFRFDKGQRSHGSFGDHPSRHDVHSGWFGPRHHLLFGGDDD